MTSPLWFRETGGSVRPKWKTDDAGKAGGLTTERGAPTMRVSDQSRVAREVSTRFVFGLSFLLMGTSSIPSRAEKADCADGLRLEYRDTDPELVVAGLLPGDLLLAWQSPAGDWRRFCSPFDYAWLAISRSYVERVPVLIRRDEREERVQLPFALPLTDPMPVFFEGSRAFLMKRVHDADWHHAFDVAAERLEQVAAGLSKDSEIALWLRVHAAEKRLRSGLESEALRELEVLASRLSARLRVLSLLRLSQSYSSAGRDLKELQAVSEAAELADEHFPVLPVGAVLHLKKTRVEEQYYGPGTDTGTRYEAYQRAQASWPGSPLEALALAVSSATPRLTLLRSLSLLEAQMPASEETLIRARHLGHGRSSISDSEELLATVVRIEARRSSHLEGALKRLGDKLEKVGDNWKQRLLLLAAKAELEEPEEGHASLSLAIDVLRQYLPNSRPLAALLLERVRRERQLASSQRWTGPKRPQGPSFELSGRTLERCLDDLSQATVIVASDVQGGALAIEVYKERATLAARQGSLTEAEGWLEQARRLADSGKYSKLHLEVLEHLAILTSQADEAALWAPTLRQWLGRAKALCDGGLGSLFDNVQLSMRLAAVENASGAETLAMSHYLDALELLESVGIKSIFSMILTSSIQQQALRVGDQEMASRYQEALVGLQANTNADPGVGAAWRSFDDGDRQGALALAGRELQRELSRSKDRHVQARQGYGFLRPSRELSHLFTHLGEPESALCAFDSMVSSVLRAVRYSQGPGEPESSLPSAGFPVVDGGLAVSLTSQMLLERLEARLAIPDSGGAPDACSRDFLASVKAQLGADAAAVVYVRHSHGLTAHIVKPGAPLRSVETAWKTGYSSERLADLVGEVRAGAQANRPSRVAAADLYDFLIRPVEQEILSAGRLVVVPDGELWALPFGLLYNEEADSFLVESHVLNVVPSLSQLLRRPSRSDQDYHLDSVVVAAPSARDSAVGLADLPGARIEAAAIADSYQITDVLLGVDATPSAVLEGLRDARVVHIAAHSVDGCCDPLGVGVQLAPDQASGGLLQAWELALAKGVVSELVVLSMCDSAGSYQGHSPLGLATVLLEVGVDSVVASLWPVEDQSVGGPMAEMHRAYSSGSTAAEALRAVQLQALRSLDSQGLAAFALQHYGSFRARGVSHN